MKSRNQSDVQGARFPLRGLINFGGNFCRIKYKIAAYWCDKRDERMNFSTDFSDHFLVKAAKPATLRATIHNRFTGVKRAVRPEITNLHRSTVAGTILFMGKNQDFQLQYRTASRAIRFELFLWRRYFDRPCEKAVGKLDQSPAPMKIQRRRMAQKAIVANLHEP